MALSPSDTRTDDVETGKIYYYDNIEFAPSTENPTRLVFVAARNAGAVPENVRALRRGYEETARIISLLFLDQPKEKKEIFDLLHESADHGLRGPDFNVDGGIDNLEEVKKFIVDRAHGVRDKRLAQYTMLAIVVGIVPLLIGVLVYLTKGFGYLSIQQTGQPPDLFALWVLAAFWIPAGAAICVWAEFALRMQGILSYDQLLYMDPSRWKPTQRLTITVGISFILAFLLAFDVVQIGIGGLLLNNFSRTNPFLSLAVGGITGLAFVAVRDIISRIKPEERARP